jgi:protocatechuate 3,4-dioxygenase beta subunit
VTSERDVGAHHPLCGTGGRPRLYDRKAKIMGNPPLPRTGNAAMQNFDSSWTRRRFLSKVTAGVAAAAAIDLWAPGVFAEELTRTPAQTEGPFYPDRLPLDTDNDLLVVNDTINPAVGEVTHLTGRVLDAGGSPVRNAVVEIWQCDANGVYLHTGSGNADHRDKHFQGFGRFTTGKSGEYYFRTIKPVAYPGRTPHIHYKVKRKGQELLTTQCYVKGEPQNERDGLWRSVRDPKLRDAITVDFAPVEGSKLKELAARFDIVLGVTPEA